MKSHLQGRSWKIWFLLSWLVVIAILISGCSGKQSSKVYRVGILSGMSFAADVTDGFKAGMAELGYIEGENIIYDVQETEFDMGVYRTILQKFVDDKVDLIVVFPTEATLEAKAVAEGTNVPLLFNYAVIEGMDIVDSVREPGGNMTGVRYPSIEIASRRFDVLMKMVPEAKTVLIPYQRGYPIVEPQLDAIRPIAKAAGVNLIELPADNAAELQAEFQAMVASGESGIDAIMGVAEPLAVTPDAFEVIATFATENNIPLGGAYIVIGDLSNVFGVDVIAFDSGKLAAPLADKIFKGTPAGTIPVASADTYLRINYTVAQKFGLTVPEGLLKQADEVIR